MAKTGPESKSKSSEKDNSKSKTTEKTEMNASQAEVSYNNGLVRLGFGQYEEAIKYFDKALKANPEHAEAPRIRRLTQEKLGQDPKGGTYNLGVSSQEPGLAEENQGGIRKFGNSMGLPKPKHPGPPPTAH